MRVAAIDIGTNTLLCLIADIVGGKVKTIISDEVEIVRLGEGVHKNKEFLKEALQRADNCLKRFSQSIAKAGAQKIGAVATSAARDAKNGQELIRLGQKYGIPIKIIEGKKEALLTFLGVQTNPNFGDDIAVIDVGGGSTEITYQGEDGELKGQSLDLGGVRLTEMFVTKHPTPTADIQKMKEYSQNEFRKLISLSSKRMVAVAGTPTTIAALKLGIEYTRDSIEGFMLKVTDVEEWVQKLAPLNLEERAQIRGLEPKRADIILAGATVLAESIKALGATEFAVSTRGVRYGLAVELTR